jgi:Transposase and inactivated derivatives|nr:hypothetical protein [Citrobacter rodentium]
MFTPTPETGKLWTKINSKHWLLNWLKALKPKLILMLTKLTVETAFNAELTDHLGHEKNAPKKALIPVIATRQKSCFAMTARLN